MRSYPKAVVGLMGLALFLLGLILRMGLSAGDAGAASLSAYESPAAPNQVASTDLSTAGVDLRPVETFYTVLKDLREQYVERIKPDDEGKLASGAVKSMLAGLNDTDTRYVQPDEYKAILDARAGKFHGLGLITSIEKLTFDGVKDEHLVVVSVLPGGSGEAAGILAGDEIASINDRDVLPYDPFLRATKVVEKARADKLQGAALRKRLETEQKRIERGVPIDDAERMVSILDGEAMDLTIKRAGQAKPVKLKVTPKEFQVAPLSSSVVGDGVGLIKMETIDRDAPSRFEEALRDLNSKSCKSLVLDLRGLSGGDLKYVTDVAADLEPGKTFAILRKSRGRTQAVRLEADPGQKAWTKPVAVLVDHGTSKLAEVMAASLKDNLGAKIVGDKTFGDFSDVTLMELGDGSAVMMRTGLYLTVKNKNLDGSGIVPDQQVARGKDDAQLDAAIKLLSSTVSGG